MSYLKGQSIVFKDGGGFQAFQVWKHNFDLWVRDDGMDMKQQLEVVLGPCAQHCPCEASEQKIGQKLKT